jgi:hypothetical protein
VKGKGCGNARAAVVAAGDPAPEPSRAGASRTVIVETFAHRLLPPLPRDAKRKNGAGGKQTAARAVSVKATRGPAGDVKSALAAVPAAVPAAVTGPSGRNGLARRRPVHPAGSARQRTPR